VKIFIYCQHVWGLGHLFRMREITRALAGHDVLLATGGPTADVPMPSHVRRLELPALRMLADRQLVTGDGRALETVWDERCARLAACFREVRPDVFIVELYPFGRTAFGRELAPLLDAIRDGRLPRCRVFCSLRDILVAKRDPQAYEARVIRRLNRWFDALLVHADPALIKLDATFSRVAAIEIPVIYTGYVARPAPRDPDPVGFRARLGLAPDDRLIVVSAGGGRSGYPLLAAMPAAHRRLADRRRVGLALFTGPYLPADEFDRLKAQAGPGIQVRRFAADFDGWLAAADLSVSMAGYNTCMNILAAGTPALVWPFEGDREQPLRAARLAEEGWVTPLATADLDAAPLAARLEIALRRPARPRGSLDLAGAANTARYLAAQTRTAREGAA
jgi:predicted glycosyltransferase